MEHNNNMRQVAWAEVRIRGERARLCMCACDSLTCWDSPASQPPRCHLFPAADFGARRCARRRSQIWPTPIKVSKNEYRGGATL